MDILLLIPLVHVVRGESFGFSTLQLSNITTIFLTPHFTSVIQPLDEKLIAIFKVQCNKKLWNGICFNSTTHQDLRK